MYHPVIAIVKGDGACSLISDCQLLVLEWMDCTIEVSKKDALGFRSQCLGERHGDIWLCARTHGRPGYCIPVFKYFNC